MPERQLFYPNILFLQKQPINEKFHNNPDHHIATCNIRLQKRKNRNSKRENSTRSILIIFYDSSFPADFLANSIRNYGSDIIYSYDTLKGFAVTVPEGKTEKEAISYFSNLKGILSVQPDRKMILHDR